MRPDLVKGIVQLEPSGPPFTLRPPFGNDSAFAFGLTDLKIGYEPSAGKEAEDLETLSPDAAPLRPFLLSTRHSVANVHRRHHHDYRQKIPGAKLRDCEA